MLHLENIPDIDLMNDFCKGIVGTHDFAAFCANKHMKKSTIRQIYALNIERVGEEIQITVRGNGFLHNMVRILVGTLVEVGQGLRQPESIPELFRGERSGTGQLVPAQGLCLMEVIY